MELFYLLYLDFLLFSILLLCFGIDVFRIRKRERKKKELLAQDFPILQEFAGGEDRDLAMHDIAVLEKQLQEQFQMNCELQDYIAKWCHEAKIPLTAALLLANKIEEQSVRKSMQEQLEKMNLQVKSALLGAKVQSSLFDLQIRKTSLDKCVKNSIHNNQFFLIQKHFSVQIRIGEYSKDDGDGWESGQMGLYMASVILRKLGHTISVESEYGRGSRFTISFSDNREYFFQ